MSEPKNFQGGFIPRTTIPKWSESRKGFTLALNKGQAEALLESIKAWDGLPDLVDEDYDDLVEQLTTITGGE